MSTQATGPHDAHSAKAQARADKAYKKAMRPWYKKKRFIIPLILLALIAISAAMSGGSDDTQNAGTSQDQSNSAPQNTEGEDAAKTVGIGQPATDGKFEFTVTEVEDAGKTIGEEFSKEEAQGTWKVVHLNVKNIGNEAASLTGESQEAFDKSGNKYSPQTVIGLEGWDKAFVNEINPGNTVKDAVIPFDVPEGTELTKIQLHEGMFSGGVEVNLAK